MKRVNLWLLFFVIFYRILIAQSEKSLPNESNGHSLYSGRNENHTTNLLKRIYKTPKYNRKVVTSSFVKSSSTSSNNSKIKTVGTALYKRRYRTTSNLKDFSIKRKPKHVPFICSCDISKKKQTTQLKRKTTKRNDSVDKNVTGTPIRKGVNLKTRGKGLNNSTTYCLSPKSFVKKRKSTVKHQSLKRGTKSKVIRSDNNHYKENISYVKMFPSSIRKKQKPTSRLRDSEHEINEMIVNYKQIIPLTPKPFSSTDITAETKHSSLEHTALHTSVSNSFKEKTASTIERVYYSNDVFKIKTTPRRSTRYAYEINRSSTSNNFIKERAQYHEIPTITRLMICTKCCKKILPFHTLVKTNLSTASSPFPICLKDIFTNINNCD